MIKSEKGNVTISGIGAEVVSDFSSITVTVIDSMVNEGMDIEFAELVIDKAVEAAKKNSSSRRGGKHDGETEVPLKKILGKEV